MDSTEETLLQEPETPRRTRSGRVVKGVPTTSPKPSVTTRRSSRKKTNDSDEDAEMADTIEATETSEIKADEDMLFPGEQELIEEVVFEETCGDTVFEETETIEFQEESPVKTDFNPECPEDSNSITNDFNSFKGAASSSDQLDNDTNSFDNELISTVQADAVELNNGNFEEEPSEKIVRIEKMEIDSEDKIESSPVKTDNGDIKEDVAEKETPRGKETEPEVKTTRAPDTEAVSDEDNAPAPDTEEVSDDELPGPKRAELPADTEVVSEDELPTTKKDKTAKRKLAEGAAAVEAENPSKKPALGSEVAEDEEEEEERVEKKKLPELDKYWKAVNDDSTDFSGWTYLLQYVDQENDMEAAREAYDAFLSHYPYCYGYWRKYADYEKRKGNKKKCEEVFERGLKAIPLSVDLWIHYLNYVRTKGEDEQYVRDQFERSLVACGLEFRSDRLWEQYIKWETEGKRLQHAMQIYERLLLTPTQGYVQHFENFQEHVMSNPPNKILEIDEFLALRKEVKATKKREPEEKEAENETDVPPGEDDDKEMSSDEETKAIRDRIISIRRKIHKATVSAIQARWNFEEGIKRPYFHVKSLERCQLKNWQDYLDFEIEQGDRVRIVVLFERCLIACALYEEFWIRFVHYLNGLKDSGLQPKIKDVFERACTIHHLKKPTIHLQWAMFEESTKNYGKAAEILLNLDKTVPNILRVAYRRINLERRRGDYEKCSQLFEHYIGHSKSKVISSSLAVKYARFSMKVNDDYDKAVEILTSALAKDPTNTRLVLQLIDLSISRKPIVESEVVAHLNSVLERDDIENDQKLAFAQRKLEFLEDFGSDVTEIHLAQEEFQKFMKLAKDKKKESAKGKKDKSAPASQSQSSQQSSASASSVQVATSAATAQSTGGNYQYGNYGNTATGYSGYQQQQQQAYGQYPQGYNQSSGDQYSQYGAAGWQYSQSGYGGYGQWGNYSGGYSY